MLLERGQRVLDVVTGGRPTVGVRVPSHPMTLDLLERFGGGIAAPSANRFGHVSPTTAAHVLDDVGALLDPARDAILDGGPTPSVSRAPSSTAPLIRRRSCGRVASRPRMSCASWTAAWSPPPDRHGPAEC